MISVLGSCSAVFREGSKAPYSIMQLAVVGVMSSSPSLTVRGLHGSLFRPLLCALVVVHTVHGDDPWGEIQHPGSPRICKRCINLHNCLQLASYVQRLDKDVVNLPLEAYGLHFLWSE